MQQYLVKRRQLLLRCLTLLLLSLAKASDEWKSSTLSSNKYHSYLNYPRISFAGRFKANPATGNNLPSNFDIDSFFSYDRYSIFKGGKNQWNPDRTNDLILMDCHVTSTCHIDGKCTELNKEDSICGAPLTDAGVTPFAKLADCDSTAQFIPEIFGLKIRVPGFFEGDMKSTPLAYFWNRGVGTEDSAASATYQSTIDNVRWAENANSSVVIRQVRETMQHIGSKELSIIFTLDLFRIIRNHDFSMGRILGTIGVSGPSAPQVRVMGRSLAPLIQVDADHVRLKGKPYTSHAPFVIDQKMKKLHIGFLNSFITIENGDPKPFPSGTNIGYFPKSKDVGDLAYPAGSCEESAVVIKNIASISLTRTLRKFGGVVDIDLTKDQLEELSGLPLSLFQINGSKCNLFMQEYKDGIFATSFQGWQYRLDHGQQIKHKLFVTKFGEPCQNISITLTPDDTPFTYTKGYGFKQPPPFRSLVRLTDKDGIANFVFPTRSSHTYTRIGIDGNVEGYVYTIENSSMAYRLMNQTKFDRLIVARVFHNYSYPDEVTWTDHVQPIFKTYANMFPVMRSRGFNMNNYFDVVDHKEILRLAIALPISHPSYMPVNRDLSKVKKEMILRWLNKEVPPFGDVTKLLTRNYLLNLLQTALEVTHASIPLMLNALWSIKKGHNKYPHKILLNVLQNEFEKIDLLARLMTKLGHFPKFFHQEFVLHYPSRLPNGLQKDLLLSLEKLSEGFIRDNIIALKRPEINKLNLWFRTTIFRHAELNMRCHGKKRWRNPLCNSFRPFSHWYDYLHRKKCKTALNVMLKNSINNLKPDQTYNPYVDPQDRTIFKYRTTVDSLYNHILFVLSFVTDCGSNNAIFHNVKAKKNRNRQHSYKNKGMENDYFMAVNDIRRIISITNSMSHQSQYSLLCSVAEDRYTFSDVTPYQKVSKIVIDEANGMVKDLQVDSRHQQHIPNIPHIPSGVVQHGVWPIVSNAKVAIYPKGKVLNLATAFNDIYTFYLITYEKAFKAKVAKDKKKYWKNLKELKKAFFMIGHRLVQTPIRGHAGKHVGPNAAPTFEIDFAIARTGFLENATMINMLKDVDWDVDVHMHLRKKILKEFAGLIQPSEDSIDQNSQTEAQVLSKMSSSTESVYQPICKNPFIDLKAIYNTLPIF